MLKVTVGNNLDRKAVFVDENAATIKSVLDDNGIDYATGNIHLNGSSVQPGDMYKTFAELGVNDSCYLLRIVE